MNLRISKRSFDNKGFSIVELLIAVAIASIVGVAVFGFMSVGAKNFNWNSSEINLQNESQLAFNQMQDLIIDTAIGVEYYKCDYNSLSSSISSETKVEKDSEIGASDDKLLRLNNSDVVYEILWDRSDSKMYYGEFKGTIKYDAEGNQIVDKGATRLDAAHPYVLMSEYIKGFTADLSRLISNRVVRIDLIYEKAGQTLATSHNITLRNQVVSSNKLEKHIREAYKLSSNKVPKTIEGKKVIYVEPGQTFNLMTDAKTDSGMIGYTVKDSDDEIMSNEARFKCQGHIVGQTRIGNTNGILEVSKDEPGPYFTVSVYSQHKPALDYTVTVRVVRVNSLSVNFVKDSRSGKAKDEIENGIFSDDLVTGELFSLNSNIKVDSSPYGITWTRNKLENQRDSDALYSETTEADKQKLDKIALDASGSIYYQGKTGYNTFFKENHVGGLNSPSCEFVINSFSLGAGNTTAPISVVARCKYSETKYNDPVETPWSGNVYKKDEKFHIDIKDNDFNRGQPYTDTIKFDDDFQNADKFAKLIYVSVKTDPADETLEKNISGYIRSYLTKYGSEGDDFTWIIPYTWDPYKKITITFRGFIAPEKADEDSSHIHVLPSDTYIATYDSKGNLTGIPSDWKECEPASREFERFWMSYIKKAEYNNVALNNIFVKDENGNSKNTGNYATYYVHGFNESSSSPSGMNTTWLGDRDYVKFSYDWSPQFKYQPSWVKQSLIKDDKTLWKLSYITDSGWEEFDGTGKYKDAITCGKKDQNDLNNANSLFNYYLYNDEIYLSSCRKNWDSDKLPQRIRINPIFTIFKNQSYGKGEDKLDSDVSYVIDDNYIECVFWNIVVPYNPEGISIFSGTENCYFPEPEGTINNGELVYNNRFPGKTGSIPVKWYYAGYQTKTDGIAGVGVKNTHNLVQNDYYDLFYTLSEDRKLNGQPSTWTLKLYEGNKAKKDEAVMDSEGNYISFAKYVYDYDKKMWIESNN